MQFLRDPGRQFGIGGGKIGGKKAAGLDGGSSGGSGVRQGVTSGAWKIESDRDG
jgi:hypothetical protein